MNPEPQTEEVRDDKYKRDIRVALARRQATIDLIRRMAYEKPQQKVFVSPLPGPSAFGPKSLVEVKIKNTVDGRQPQESLEDYDKVGLAVSIIRPRDNRTVNLEMRYFRSIREASLTYFKLPSGTPQDADIMKVMKPFHDRYVLSLLLKKDSETSFTHFSLVRLDTLLRRASRARSATNTNRLDMINRGYEPRMRISGREGDTLQLITEPDLLASLHLVLEGRWEIWVEEYLGSSARRAPTKSRAKRSG